MTIAPVLNRLAKNETATVPIIFRHLRQADGLTIPTILVVDDSVEISNFLAKKLLPRFGYKALQAKTGKEGLEIIRKFRPDLALLDLQLPDMDGLDILRELAKEDHSVPAILMTGHGSEQVAVDAFRLGVQDYFTKPVDPDVLEQVIARILSQKNMQQEKVKLTSQLAEQVTWLRTLSRVGQSVTSTLEINEVLRRIVEAGVYLTKAEEGFLALIDEQSGQLYLRASKNIEELRTRTTRLLINDPMIGEVIRTGKPVRISTKTDYPSLKVSTGYLVTSLIHVPILSRGKILGILSVDHRHNLHNFLDRDEAMLTSLADYAAIAIENAMLLDGLVRSNYALTRAYDATIEGWSAALDLRDKETEGHTQRVTDLTLKLAVRMGFKKQELVYIRRGALLHDIGKMGVPDRILHKPSKLTEDEWIIMRKHPQFAYDMLSPIQYLRGALDIPYCHHEKWDGTGYPRGLRGEDIPLTARIFAIVDVWDALTSNRPYRTPWSRERTLEHIRSLSGSHFDPQVVKAFLEIIDEEIK